jgi:hypothetical protein
MPPRPDPRWQLMSGGITPQGQLRPMSFEVLEGLADEWAMLVPGGLEGWGSLTLLRKARSLFVHSWFDYEFMVLACLVGLQAVEAAFREIYPDASKVPLRALVRRAQERGVLPTNIADLAATGAELRNHLSHPLDQGAFTVGMAAPVLENTHRLVVLLIAAARKEEMVGSTDGEAPTLPPTTSPARGLSSRTRNRVGHTPAGAEHA